MYLWFFEPLMTTRGSENYQDSFLYVCQDLPPVRNDIWYSICKKDFPWNLRTEVLLCCHLFQATSGVIWGPQDHVYMSGLGQWSSLGLNRGARGVFSPMKNEQLAWGCCYTVYVAW